MAHTEWTKSEPAFTTLKYHSKLNDRNAPSPPQHTDGPVKPGKPRPNNESDNNPIDTSAGPDSGVSEPDEVAGSSSGADTTAFPGAADPILVENGTPTSPPAGAEEGETGLVQPVADTDVELGDDGDGGGGNNEPEVSPSDPSALDPGYVGGPGIEVQDPVLGQVIPGVDQDIDDELPEMPAPGDPRAEEVATENAGTESPSDLDPPAEVSVSVTNAAELFAALKNATGGETILLAAGDYGDLSLYGPKHPFSKFPATVTIRSESSESPASFSSISLSYVENLTFQGIVFDYKAAAGAPEWAKPFKIDNSKNITIADSVFDGDLAVGLGAGDGFGTGHALTVSKSTNISVEGNEFFNWHRAAVFGETTGLTVARNDVHHIRSDGFDFAEVNNVLIEGNHFHDFMGAAASGDHMDMIQFWTTGTDAPSFDVVIRGNFLNSGEGSPTQSIFIRNQAVDHLGAGPEMFYRNFLIEDNVIHNAHTHGITVGETDGLTIRNNTLLHNRDSGSSGLVNVPTIIVKDASSDVLVENNIVPRLDISGTVERIVQNNLIVQNTFPTGEAYYGDLFVDALAGSKATFDDLKAQPEGLIEKTGVGSSLTRFDSTPEIFAAYLINDSGEGLELLTHSFDATNFFDRDGRVDLEAATVEWDFGDGQAAHGLQVSHTFDGTGERVVTATVTLTNGAKFEVDKTILVQSPVALSVTFDDGAGDLSDVVNAVKLSDLVSLEQTDNGQAIRLNGGSMTYAATPDFRNNSEYTVQFDLLQEPGDAAGYVAYFPGSFVVRAGPSSLTATVTLDGSNYKLSASGLSIGDMDWHRVSLTFSSEEGSVRLYLDGQELDHVNGLQGAIQIGSSSHDLSIGSPFTSSYSGMIDNFEFLRGAMDAEAIRASYLDMKEAHVQRVQETMIAGAMTELEVSQAFYDDSHLAFGDEIGIEPLVETQSSLPNYDLI